jgi:Clp amino terminal domain, pathogenicity island component
VKTCPAATRCRAAAFSDSSSRSSCTEPLISEGEGVAAQVLAKLGADLDRARTRVHGYPDEEPTSTGTERPERESGTGYLASRINTVESQLSALEVRLEATESRLSALEFRVGTGPDMRALETEIAQTRRRKQAALGERDFEAATSLQVKERRLLDEKGSHRRE